MAIEIDLRNVIITAVPSHVYIGFAPSNILSGTTAYAVYFRVGGEGQRAVGGRNTYRRARFQVNVWAKTYGEAAAKADAVSVAISNAQTFTGFALSEPHSVHEDEFGWYGLTQDYRIAWQEA